MTILQFHIDGNDYLSNFYKAELVWDGIIWPTAEHAYQAAKSLSRAVRLEISRMPAHQAGLVKKLGRNLEEIDPNWDTKKVDIMTEIVRAKFNQNPDLKKKLLDTGNCLIEEGNNWGDVFWGICPPGSGIGENNLGIILMQLREEFKNKIVQMATATRHPPQILSHRYDE